MIDAASKVPTHEQIKEQVKLALFFGELRPGDTLPSIRELAGELGIGAAIVRTAYSELVKAGVLASSRSKRSVVNPNLDYQRNGDLQRQTRRLASSVLEQVLKLGIHPNAFANYFQHWIRQAGGLSDFVIMTECNRFQADQYAKEASAAWGISVSGKTFDELRKMSSAQLHATQYLLTVTYHYGEAQKIARKHHKKIIPIAIQWDPTMVEHIGRQKKDSRIAFVFRRQDLDSYGRLIVREIEQKFHDRELRFECLAMETLKSLTRIVQSSSLVYFSNRLWEELPEKIKNDPKVSPLRLITDPLSLEKARTAIGLIS
ncbi:MAG: GntR family transcriptional regulator [Candidatus Acidiferrales bacterium]